MGNRNIAVLQTTVAELVPHREHQRELISVLRAQEDELTDMDISSGVRRHAVGLVHRVSRDDYSYQRGRAAANRSFSSIVGPMIGGALAKPVENLPSVFAPGSLWDRFPYFLPNLFSAICVTLGVVIGLLFLEETHAEKKLERDRGVELGNFLLSYLPGNREVESPAKEAEEQPLLFETEESLPGYLTNSGAAGSSSAAASSSSEQQSIDFEEVSCSQGSNAEAKTTTIFTKPVLTIIASYGILAL